MSEPSQRNQGDEASQDEAEQAWRKRVEDLFSEHNKNLIGFLMPRLKSEQAARDIAQEAYVRLLQLDKPDSTNFLQAYLFKIAGNLAIDYTRRKIRYRKYTTDNPLIEFSAAATQERSVSAGQQIGLVKKAVGELPKKCRQAFLLSKVHGWSSSRIAVHVNVSDRMVRLYIARALEHIQLKLEDNYDDTTNPLGHKEKLQ